MSYKHAFIFKGLLLLLIGLPLLRPISLVILHSLSCGALIPHDHILLGDAPQADLHAHLLAEQACHSPSIHEMSRSTEVISVLRDDLHLAGRLLNLTDGVISINTLSALMVISGITWSLRPMSIRLKSLPHPP